MNRSLYLADGRDREAVAEGAVVPAPHRLSVTLNNGLAVVAEAPMLVGLNSHLGLHLPQRLSPRSKSQSVGILFQSSRINRLISRMGHNSG